MDCVEPCLLCASASVEIHDTSCTIIQLGPSSPSLGNNATVTPLDDDS